MQRWVWGEGGQDRRAPGPINCSCIFGIAAIHGGKTRTSSLHMDVRSLACPELLYLATSAGYEVQNKKILRSSNSKELERITRHCPRSER